MPNFGYHLARLRGRFSREVYRRLLPSLGKRRLAVPRSVSLDVFAYSGENTLPEQVVSIRSFLRWVGRPQTFTIVSDGTHSHKSIHLLQSIDDCISVNQAKASTVNAPAKLQTYLDSHPTGKQLALIMSLPIRNPALYVDSDVLFFPGAVELARQATRPDASAYYLADCQFSGDGRLLRHLDERSQPVNTGVLLLFGQLDWSFGIDRFLELDGEPGFFTNQTITHLTMHKNAARPFDPEKYVLQLDDQFVFSDRYANPSLVLRHYVNPVRHKFWTR